MSFISGHFLSNFFISSIFDIPNGWVCVSVDILVIMCSMSSYIGWIYLNCVSLACKWRVEIGVGRCGL